jgi:CDP-diacylglycerol--glycerol-3-phosphate 3-phosphatidyltransferase
MAIWPEKMGLETPFGAFLDPVADKLIVVVALIILLEVHSTIWFALPTLVIIGREVGDFCIARVDG